VTAYLPPYWHASTGDHPRRRTCPRLCHRRHPVRGARLLLCRPDRRAQPADHLLPVLRNVRDNARARSDPLRHPEGQGLCAGRSRPPTSITASRSSTSSPARRRKPKPNAPSLHQGVRRVADPGRPRGRPDRRHHRGDAGGHRHRSVRKGPSRTAPSMSASPSSMP
jgi:hypothetical protein